MRIEIAEAAMAKTAAGASVTSAAASFAVGDWVGAFVGLPFGLLLAGFAGAAGVLSFMPKRPLGRAAGTVVFCSLLGGYAALWLPMEYPLLHGADKFLAIVISTLAQIFTPVIIDQAGPLLIALRSKFGIGGEK